MRTKLEYLAKQTAKEDQCLTVIFMDWWCNQNFRLGKTKVKQSKQKLMVMFWERRWSWKSLKMISDRERSTNSTHWQQNGGAIHLQGNPGNKGLAKRKRLLQPPIWNRIILYIMVLIWNSLKNYHWYCFSSCTVSRFIFGLRGVSRILPWQLFAPEGAPHHNSR